MGRQLVALIVLAMFSGLVAPNVWAQNALMRGGRYMPPRMPMAEDDLGDEDEGGDESASMFDRASRGDEASQPRTALGKYIRTLDFSRTPETVLKARAQLAARERESRLNPPNPAEADGDGEAEEPQTDGEPGADPGVPGDERGVAEMTRAMIEAAMRGEIVHAPEEAGLAGIPDAQDDADSGSPARGAGKLTRNQRKQGDRFRLMVVAGDWAGVRSFLTETAGEDAEPIYAHVLRQLSMDRAIVPDEVIAVSDASPGELRDPQIVALGRILKATLARGADGGHVAALIERGTRHFGKGDSAKRQRAASFLMAAGMAVDAHPFLDPVEQARADSNGKLMNLHAAYYLALRKRQTDAIQRSESLRKCWELCTEVLALKESAAPDRSVAIGRIVGFLDEISSEDGDAWLRTVFATSPDLAWALVERANQKARSAREGMAPADQRVRALKRLQRLGNALIDGAGERAGEYRTALDMMALSIIEEAEMTKQRALYQGQDQVTFVEAEQLQEVLPTPAWLRAGDPGLAARLELMAAGVAGSEGDVNAVLEMVRPLAAVDKPRAQKIADSIIESWPTSVRGQPQYDEYAMYGGARMGGMGGRYYPGAYGGYNPYGGYGGGVPLTRARQRRNLEQLGTLLAEFKRLGLESPPTDKVVAAFAASHSDAEVFGESDIVAVFGPTQSLEANSAAAIAESMRSRLGTIWRNAQVQQQAATKRNDKQIAAEVLRGYELALRLVESAAAGDTRDWRARMLLADLQFDHAEYLYGQGTDLATYAGLREASFAGYMSAVDTYAVALASGMVHPTALVYSHWMNSALGASDLGFLTRQDMPDEDQIDRVIAALQALPEPMRHKHIGLVAGEVIQAMQRIAPELKVRYLTNACRIIGTHPDGAAARKQLAYYVDLQREVELVLKIDGGSDVGTDPFGATLAVWTTRAVSRESGGFAKYLMNQQYHPMTGQPIDYKDELEKRLRDALSERFELSSISFHKPGIPPMGVGREGWEQHPIAYLVLKAKDASVDRIPSLRIDLDFNDGRGLVIMPVSSSEALIDARTAPPRRVPADLEVEQVLDDREAASGVVSLEIRAKGRGLIPTLNHVLRWEDSPFEVARAEDFGLAIIDLDTSGGEVVPVCERTWTLTLRPAGKQPASLFTFPASEGTRITKRYADADIVQCGTAVSIAEVGVRRSRWIWWALGGGVALMAGTAAWRVLRRRPVAAVAGPRFKRPSHLTPVSAIGTLQRLASVPQVAWADPERRELAAAIGRMEARFFGPGTPETGVNGEVERELESVVERWIESAERRWRD